MGRRVDDVLNDLRVAYRYIRKISPEAAREWKALLVS
jgi:hypothetical protein